MKFDMHVNNIKNMQSNDYIFKIYRCVNFLVGVWRVSLQISLERNFVFHFIVQIRYITKLKVYLVPHHLNF